MAYLKKEYSNTQYNTVKMGRDEYFYSFANIDDLNPSKYTPLQMTAISVARADKNFDASKIDKLDPSEYTGSQMFAIYKPIKSDSSVA